MSPSHETTATRQAPILWLPPELVIMVSQSLSVDDMICLALTCRNLYQKVDAKDSWDKIKVTKLDDKVRGKEYKVTKSALMDDARAPTSESPADLRIGIWS